MLLFILSHSMHTKGDGASGMAFVKLLLKPSFFVECNVNVNIKNIMFTFK